MLEFMKLINAQLLVESQKKTVFQVLRTFFTSMNVLSKFMAGAKY